MFRCLTQSRVGALARVSANANAAQIHGLRHASTEAVESNSADKLWRITLKRSPIGLHPKTRENARVLGLTRCGHVVYRHVSPEMAGKILKVKELVKIELVDQIEPVKTKAPTGFEIIGRLNPRIAPGSKAAKPLLPLRKKK
ncbi:39S ribosomal protein L33, mitochondrial [Coemansia sp. RSA 353]|nr:39S ribosomal protein L33, mitochondrial [Coemansia sp. RSA 564]KAJ2188939.1 39S ribosomal protein L33, mitochondrial [Coemansia sp. RSA 532]KAJ2195147.1 39S ribosomal protein L33, mitochondrial [Coemansia sp. RSA 530]KAJ2207281.1 39S ribosomal protein L33, mitochondrial [Coemansia sp. RSA 521]KAJ2214883.1 39S ribosomal protein L33, mitochondrial [Coemansia sp. RSA 520]KAJ2288622.1 39S ribosomal protein L33, mitochondrial [Coemansia sp. RSA 355]KAJ2299590.1 39S ribosomal protein L33, mitoc